MFHFQSSLMKLQLQFERSLTAIAQSTWRPSILIFDRGLLDPKGYMTPDTWTRVLGSQPVGSPDRPMDEVRLLARYDGVVHLVIAADGAERFYKWGQVTDDSGIRVLRTEPPDEAVAKDKKMRACWKNHPNHLIIPNSKGGFKTKLQEASSFVLGICLSIHPEQGGSVGRTPRP